MRNPQTRPQAGYPISRLPHDFLVSGGEAHVCPLCACLPACLPAQLPAGRAAPRARLPSALLLTPGPPIPAP
jgi:hypothetical protein